MPDKDVDEQFAAIMAHWDDVALGIDPFGDPLADDGDEASDAAGTTPDVAPEVASAPGVESPTGAEGDTSPSDPSNDLGRAAGPEESSPRGSSRSEASPPADPGTAVAPPPAPQTPSKPQTPSRPRAQPRPPLQPLPEDDAPPVAGSGWRQHDPPDVEEHFVPPPPAPLPSSDDKHFWLMMVGLIGGPLLFLYLILFNRDGNGWWMMFALGMAIAGFVLLVLRQPAERDENDDGVRL